MNNFLTGVSAVRPMRIIAARSRLCGGGGIAGVLQQNADPPVRHDTWRWQLFCWKNNQWQQKKDLKPLGEEKQEPARQVTAALQRRSGRPHHVFLGQPPTNSWKCGVSFNPPPPLITKYAECNIVKLQDHLVVFGSRRRPCWIGHGGCNYFHATQERPGTTNGWFSVNSPSWDNAAHLERTSGGVWGNVSARRNVSIGWFRHLPFALTTFTTTRGITLRR